MHRVLGILGLILVCVASPMAAQEAFDLPFELELPDLPLVLELDNATLDVLLDPGSTSLLRARSFSDQGSPKATLVLGSDGGRVLVRREDSEDSEEPGPRIGLELVLDPQRWLSLTGADLDVGVQAQPVEGQPGEDEDDEDDKGDEDDEDDEDDKGDEDDEESHGARPGGGDAASDHSLALEVEASSIQLVGVQGASVKATGSYLHATGTGGDLALILEGGTAEILEHRGVLVVTSRDSEVTVSELLGRAEASLFGGSLVARSGMGQLESQLDGALLRVDGWRGRLKAEGRGSRVEARALRGVRLEVQGENLDVALEEHQGHFSATLRGGRLSASELKGQAVISAQNGAEISLDRLAGGLTLGIQGGSARLVSVRGHLRANVADGRLEIEGAQQLELAAQRAEIVAGRLERLGRVEVTDSQLDLDLSELVHNPTLALKGSSEARVQLRAPCSVKLGEVELLSSRADVTGCELHSQTLRRTRYDSRGLDGQRRVLLTATLGEDSTLEVEGVP